MHGLRELCWARCRDRMDQELFIKKEHDRLKRESVSREIADRLEGSGITAYRNDVNLSLVGVVSGESRPLTSYANTNMIEDVAKRNRSRHLQFLEYSLFRHPDMYRMQVINTGDRVPLLSLREKTKLLHRNLSKFAKENRDIWGVDMVFRSTEYGTMKRTPEGEATFHPHAHCAVKTPRMGSARYSKYLKWANKRWRSMNNMSSDKKWQPIKDAGKIRDARELCKYMVKCNDYLALTHGSKDSELAQFHKQTRKLQFVKFLGSLREERALMKDQDTRPVRYMLNGEENWRIVRNWNTHSPEKKEAISMARQFAGGKGKRCNAGHVGDADIVLALTAPSFHFSHEVCEPAVLVNDYSGSFNSLRAGSIEVDYIYRETQLVLEVHPSADALGYQRDPDGSPSNVHNDITTVLRNMTVADYRRIRRAKKALMAEIPT